MSHPLPRLKASWLVRLLALALAASGVTGCQLYHRLGTGERYDAPPEKHASGKSRVVHDIVLEVTTNASSVVTQVQFRRSSGSADLDAYIADSVRSQWTGGPSTRSVVELTYSGEAGFSDPKVISTSPAG